MLWAAREVLGLPSWGHSADACPKEPRSKRCIIVHGAAALVHKDPWDNRVQLSKLRCFQSPICLTGRGCGASLWCHQLGHVMKGPFTPPSQALRR